MVFVVVNCVNSVLGLLYHVVVDDVAVALEVHAASIFRV
jgi:hypothetical protein